MATSDNGEARRIIRRRRGMVFSSNSMSSSTEGAGDVAEEPSDDADINDMVAQQVQARPQALPAPQSDVIAGNPTEEFNPAARLAQVRARSTEYEREYRLGLMHRLMMRRIPMDEIAAQLGISVAQAYRDRALLREKFREETNALTVEDLIGDSKGYYEEVAAMAMRAASASNQAMPIRLAAMRTALAAKNDQHRFFQAAGVYDVLRFRAADKGGAVSDVQRLLAQTERLLSGHNLSDPDADSGDPETVDL